MQIKRLLLSISVVLFFAVSFTSCSSSKQMAKNGKEMIRIECTPKVLQVVNNQINADYKIIFPEGYFRSGVILEVVPVLVYDGGEEIAESFRLQGDGVADNYAVIPKSGGYKEAKLSIAYKPGMEKSHLELRIFAVDGDKRIAFGEPFRVADGANFTYKLVYEDGLTALMPHDYKRELIEEKETQIQYNINSADVKQTELSKAETKAFKKFLKDIEKDSKRKVKSTNIVAYASPEGKEDFNTKLSDKRSKSAKAAYDKIATKAASGAPVEVRSISEDWDGFQDLVKASNIPDKELILRVLSMYSDSQIREREIKNMSKVYSTLAEKILPELRRARVITNVGYVNYSEEELLQIANSDPKSLDIEALLYSAVLTKDLNKREELYRLAIDKYRDERAVNNLAATYIGQEKFVEAEKVLANSSSKQGDYYYNNIGLIALHNKDYKGAAEAFSKSELPEAKQNSAIVDILTGKYEDASNKLQGSGNKNEGLAYILADKLDLASEAIHGETPYNAYLRAIIAARKQDFSEVARQLRVVYKDDLLAERSQKDIEFAKFRE